jgi:tRNA (guanine37-N1)-methyltransferase
MRIDLISLFPNIFDSFKQESIVKRSILRGIVSISAIDPRGFCSDKHNQADDYPFGGGPGMLLKAEPLSLAIEECRKDCEPHILNLSPVGSVFNQAKARELASKEHLVLICGHYEGIDQRVIDRYVDEEISIGDYILSGGEVAAMVVVDTIIRLVPGVLGSASSAVDESFEDSLLEYPQYTRPYEFNGEFVPDVLLSGNHKEIAAWRRTQAIKRTWQKRVDLLLRADLSIEDRKILLNMLKENRN